MNSDFSLAVHALVYLNHKATTLSSEELAENICTNPARVRRVMARLKKAGLVLAKEGSAGGGYRFPLTAEEISLAQVARALEVRFVSAAWRSGDLDMDCLVASGMAGLMDEVFEELNERCMARLEELTIADFDRRLFGGRESAPPQAGGDLLQ